MTSQQADGEDRATPCQETNWIAGGDAGETCGCTVVSDLGYCARCGAHRREYDRGEKQAAQPDDAIVEEVARRLYDGWLAKAREALRVVAEVHGKARPAGARVVYIGCPTCGMVTTALLDEEEQPPWCMHDGHTIVWRERHRGGTEAGRGPWTRTQRVAVIWARTP